MFYRLEEASGCIQMRKKRVLDSSKPLKVLPTDIMEEPFLEKGVFSLRNLKKISENTDPLEFHTKLDVLAVKSMQI